MPPKNTAGATAGLPPNARIIYDQCLATSRAMSQEQIQSILPSGQNSVEQVTTIVNLLLNARLLSLLAQSDGTVLYRAVASSEANVMSGMDGDELMVYQYIKAAGDEGIWSKHIANRTNLHAQVVKKALESLQKKSVIKLVKSVQYPTRKVYMLYDLVPSQDVSGGSWFTDSAFDEEFVTTLTNAIERYIQEKSRPKNKAGVNLGRGERIYSTTYTGYPTEQEIHKWLMSTGIVTVDLSLKDTNSLLSVLIADKKIEKRADGLSYSSVSPYGQSGNTLTEIPCGHCPVFNLCTPGGAVSPEGCVYWGDWLSQNL